MATVTAAEVSSDFDVYQDAALHDPVVITENGRPRTVLIAYDEFIRLSKRDRAVQLTDALNESEIAAVEASATTPYIERLENSSVKPRDD